MTKKIKNDTLHLDEKVLVLNPRYRSNSLTYRWYGPGRVIQCKHPVYEIFFQDKNLWYLRNKLKRVSNEFPLPNNESFQELSGEEEVKMSSSSANEETAEEEANEADPLRNVPNRGN